MRTNTNKLISGALLASMTLMSSVHAATNIGSGTVSGSGGLTTNIVWNDTFPGTATGTINGLVIKAKVQPTLNMTITGSGIIDLGTLTSAGYSSGSVNIEIGTNAKDGASVTAKSTNGGLKNTSDPTIFINSLTADGVADSYKFTSAIVAAHDSSYSGTFTQSATLNAEVSDTTTNHVLYTSNKPQATSGTTDDFSFTVSAKPNAQTAAGNYSDVVTVTVTGNF